MIKLLEWFNSPIGKTLFRLSFVVISMLSRNGIIPFDPVVMGVPFHDFILSGVVTPTGSFTKASQNASGGW